MREMLSKYLSDYTLDAEKKEMGFKLERKPRDFKVAEKSTEEEEKYQLAPY